MGQLGLREVLLEESDCRQLLENLELQTAAHSSKDDNVHQRSGQCSSAGAAKGNPDVDPDAQRETTPRSPRDASASNPPSRPSLLTPLNLSCRSGINSQDGRSEAAPPGRSSVLPDSAIRTPMWRCFVKSLSLSHILLVILPASFQDLKLLMLNDEQLFQSTRSSRLTKVKPDFIPPPGQEPDSHHDVSLDSKSAEEAVSAKQLMMETTDDDQMTASCSQPHSQSASQPSSLAPTRTNSFAGQQRPRLPSHSSVQVSRIRAGSLDTAPSSLDQQTHPQSTYQPPHVVHASASVGSADRRTLHTKTSATATALASGAYFRPIAPSSLPSSSSPVRPAPACASLNLPVYVFDCPLNNLINHLLFNGTSASKVELFRDHTFLDEEDQLSASTSRGIDEKEEDGQTESDPAAGSGTNAGEDPVSAGSRDILSRYCDVVEALYCKCLGQALFTSLQLGRSIHSRDVEEAMNLCKETLLEIDITAFIQNICGHLKDFRMKAGLESIRQQRLSTPVASGNQSAEETDAFPLSLLRLHQPCVNLKHLHRLIRTRFQEILCLSFKPVPSLSDFYFYCPPDHPMSPSHQTNNPADDTDTIGQQHELSLGLDDHEALVEFRQSFGTDQSSGKSGSSRTCSVAGARSNSGSEPIDDVEWDEDEDGQEEIPAVPLFLHLTATVRTKKDVASQSLNALPTCLGDLMNCLSGNVHLRQLFHV